MKRKIDTDPEILKNIAEWAKPLKIDISPEKLSMAFIHSSYAHEKLDIPFDNERLEYLGDAVISLAICEYLFNKFPEDREGELSQLKSQIVSARELGLISKNLGIGKCLLLGTGEDKSGGRTRNSLLCNTFEALTGVIFLEKGYIGTRDWLIQILQPLLKETESSKSFRDNKTLLQEYVQKNWKVCPVYEVFSTSGPDHKKEFRVRVLINGKSYGIGKGMNKKESEQDAAQNALKKILSDS